jgi:sugar phosphate isomerase/epimerase
MENALAIGCTQVLIVPSRSLVGQALEDAITRFTDSLSQLSKKAEQLGVRLGVETLNPQLSDYAKQSAQVMAFIDAIGSDSLGVVLDTGHLCLSGEDFTSAVKNVGSRLMEVHFNDNDGKVQQNAVPGEGVIDFPAVFRVLQAQGYGGFVTLELGWQYSPDPQPALKLALDRTQRMQAQA